jgi:hypothetical protein
METAPHFKSPDVIKQEQELKEALAIHNLEIGQSNGTDVEWRKVDVDEFLRRAQTWRVGEPAELMEALSSDLDQPIFHSDPANGRYLRAKRKTEGESS